MNRLNSKLIVYETNETKEQKVLFETIRKNMTPFGKNGNGKYSMSIPVELLRIDPLYQRDKTRKEAKLKNLAKKWNENKLTPITVVPHPESYCFMIVDGYGRYIVSTTMLEEKYEYLDAIILTNVPSEIEERRKFEAEIFIEQGDEVEKITPIQMHKAKVLIGDVPAVIVDNICKKYSLKIAPTKGLKERKVLLSYSTTYKIAKIHGEKCIEFIFGVINNAGWIGESNGLNAYAIYSLKNIWYAHPEERERKELFDYLSDLLREMSPSLFLSKARASYPERDYKSAPSLWLEDKLVENMGYKRAIYKEGDKKVKIVDVA